jgi:uncharacterized membrane protein YeaQ/YmgE (transglycosylase-associated protein family)
LFLNPAISAPSAAVRHARSRLWIAARFSAVRFWQYIPQSCAFGIAFAITTSRVFTSGRNVKMGILMFIVFGLVVGLLARALMPGRQSMGLGMTTLLGIAGSFIGGFVGALLTDSRVGDFNTAGIIGSILGAMLLLLAVGGLSGRRRLTV